MKKIEYGCGCITLICDKHMEIPKVESIEPIQEHYGNIRPPFENAGDREWPANIFGKGTRPNDPEIDTSRCIEMVSKDDYQTFVQCARKRGFGKDGVYCGQHAKQHPE